MSIDRGSRVDLNGAVWRRAGGAGKDSVEVALLDDGHVGLRDGKNPDGWVPEQKIKVEEALRAYTIEAAYAGFSEQSLGSRVERHGYSAYQNHRPLRMTAAGRSGTRARRCHRARCRWCW